MNTYIKENKTKNYKVGFQVLTAAVIKITDSLLGYSTMQFC
jgi:hypothetical protein